MGRVAPLHRAQNGVRSPPAKPKKLTFCLTGRISLISPHRIPSKVQVIERADFLPDVSGPIMEKGEEIQWVTKQAPRHR